MTTPLRVLLIEDTDDALACLHELQRGGYEVVWERVETAAALTDALGRGPWDVVLCDAVLPRLSGSAALHLLQDLRVDAPTLMVSGEVGEECAVTAMRAGAHDYLLKEHLWQLVPAVQRALREAAERRARHRAEADKTALLELVRELSASLDRTEILDRMQRRVAALLPCDQVATFQWDDVRRAFVATALHGIPPSVQAAAFGLEFARGDGLVERLLGGETVLVNDPEGETCFPPGLLEQFGIASIVGVPLLARGRAIGVIAAARHAPGPSFDTRAVQLLEGIALHVAMIIDTADLYRARQEEAQISMGLARVGQGLIQSLDRPVLLDRLSRATTEVLACDCSHTLLWDADHRLYAVVSGFGDSPEQWESLGVLKIPHELVTRLVGRLQQEEVVAPLPSELPELLPRGLLVQYGITAGMYAALRRGDQLIGVHTAGYRGRSAPFSAPQVHIMRGIAHLASLALEHARVLEELEKANRLKYDFVATMSHELRTPLNVIMGYSDLLLEGTFGRMEPEQGDVIRRVARSGCQLLELINTTLDFGRLEAGRLALQRHQVRFTEFIREIDVETRELQQKPGVSFAWQLPARLPVISTDPLKLKVVIKNLIGNAMKFTEAGSVTVRIRSRERGVEITVADTGIGIAPEVRPIMFEPFRQADSSTTRRHGGVGLGLYIVQRLVDLLDGTIAVESELGHGSTFRVWLPGKQAGQQPML